MAKRVLARVVEVKGMDSRIGILVHFDILDDTDGKEVGNGRVRATASWPIVNLRPSLATLVLNECSNQGHNVLSTDILWLETLAVA